jgi:hypothetical protein
VITHSEYANLSTGFRAWIDAAVRRIALLTDDVGFLNTLSYMRGVSRDVLIVMTVAGLGCGPVRRATAVAGRDLRFKDVDDRRSV